MKRALFACFLAVAFSAAIQPAAAQSISGVCLNDSYSCGTLYFNEWTSIYGSNLPDYPGTQYAIVIISADSSGCGSGCLYINEGSIGQTYWYDSATQINFNPYPAVPGAENNSYVYLQVYNEETEAYTNVVTLKYSTT